MGTAGCAEYALLRGAQSSDSLVYKCVLHAVGVSSEADLVVSEGRKAHNFHLFLDHLYQEERTRLVCFSVCTLMVTLVNEVLRSARKITPTAVAVPQNCKGMMAWELHLLELPARARLICHVDCKYQVSVSDLV